MLIVENYIAVCGSAIASKNLFLQYSRKEFPKILKLFFSFLAIPKSNMDICKLFVKRG